VAVVYCQVEVSASDHSSGGVPQRVLFLRDFPKLRGKGGYDRNTGRSDTERKINIFDAMNVK